MGLLADAGMFVRFAAGLKPFVQTASLDDCRNLLISPSIGLLDSDAVIRTVLDFLGAHSSANELTTEYWRQGGTLKVERREPYSTPASKVQPLHILKH